MNGRIRSMEAPVVPIRFEITDPTKSRMVLALGVPAKSVLMRIVPLATNSEARSAMNEKYSSAAWTMAIGTTSPGDRRIRK